jgi:heme/copper-type cytochrome/quinol oxidase subunit 2
LFRAINNKDTYNQLRYELYGQQQLVLDSVDDTQSETEANVEGLLQTVLIVVSVVLGTLVVVLFAAFFIRTRRWVLQYVRNKGKAVSLQAWAGPQGSRRLRFPDF